MSSDSTGSASTALTIAIVPDLFIKLAFVATLDALRSLKCHHAIVDLSLESRSADRSDQPRGDHLYV